MSKSLDVNLKQDAKDVKDMLSYWGNYAKNKTVEMKQQLKFDDENIVLRFSAMSDLHIGVEETPNDKKFRNALLKSVELAGGFNRLNLVAIAGDVFDAAPNKEAPKVKSILDESLDPKYTELFLAVGNHDAYFDEAFTGDNNKFRDAFGDYVYKYPLNYYVSDYHTVVKGFHFISVFGIDWDHCQNHMDWLEKQLEIASNDTPNKPIFIFTHVPPANTCSGSFLTGRWQSKNIGALLKKYPQSVIFAGHTHFNATTPAAVWQQEYTSVNCGTCQDNMHFFEVDRNGTMRMSTYKTSTAYSEMYRVSKPRVVTIPTAKFGCKQYLDNEKIRKLAVRAGIGIGVGTLIGRAIFSNKKKK